MRAAVGYVAVCYCDHCYRAALDAWWERVNARVVVRVRERERAIEAWENEGGRVDESEAA